MVLTTTRHACQLGRESRSPKYHDLRNYMEKVKVEGDPPIPCLHGAGIQTYFVVVSSILAAPGGPEAGAPLLHAP